MKKPMDYVYRFCNKHPNFGIPNLMKYIVGGNVVFWLLSLVNPVLMSYLSFSPAAILHGQVWRLISFIFYPVSLDFLALFAFYFYYLIGNTLERYWGTPQFTIFFFSGVILSEIFAFIVYFASGVSLNITATYIYFSMFFSFATLYPDMTILLFFIIPVKIKWLAYVNAAFFLINIFTTSFPLNMLPVVALLNFMIFCGGDLFHAAKIHKPSANTVNFRRESRRIRQEQRDKLYTHKCAVCGRTDTDYPDLEFRYCSKCAGYHCFCQDHINNHIHFTE